MKQKRASKPAEERFFAMVHKGINYSCWLWLGSLMTSGYGQFWNGERILGAHRYSYMLHNGDIPPGLVIMHTCDNVLCVNPKHLKAGTQKENLQDMYRKKRHRSKETYKQQAGENHWMHKGKNEKNKTTTKNSTVRHRDNPKPGVYLGKI